MKTLLNTQSGDDAGVYLVKLSLADQKLKAGQKFTGVRTAIWMERRILYQDGHIKIRGAPIR